MCVAVGSSMVGMNTDSVVREQIDKYNRSNGKLALGAVIINNQTTQYHLESQLNIYNDIDDTFQQLAKELGMEMPKPVVHEYRPNRNLVDKEVKKVVVKKNVIKKDAKKN